MKSSVVSWCINLCVGALLLCGAFALGAAVQYHFRAKELQDLNLRTTEARTTLAAADSLLREAFEFSNRQPELRRLMEPLIQQLQNTNAGVRPPIPPVR